MTNISKKGILEGIGLYQDTVLIFIDKPEQEAYYSEDYEPGDEFPQMLENGIIEINN